MSTCIANRDGAYLDTLARWTSAGYRKLDLVLLAKNVALCWSCSIAMDSSSAGPKKAPKVQWDFCVDFCVMVTVSLLMESWIDNDLGLGGANDGRPCSAKTYWIM